MSANPYVTYRRQAIETASPAQLIMLLYDGAIHRINRAIQAFAEGDVTTSRALLLKAQEVVAHLVGCLNEEAGDLAGHLASLYDYVYRELVQAHVEADASRAENAVRILKDLRAAWQEACVGGKA